MEKTLCFLLDATGYRKNKTDMDMEQWINLLKMASDPSRWSPMDLDQSNSKKKVGLLKEKTIGLDVKPKSSSSKDLGLRFLNHKKLLSDNDDLYDKVGL